MSETKAETVLRLLAAKGGKPCVRHAKDCGREALAFVRWVVARGLLHPGAPDTLRDAEDLLDRANGEGQ